MNSESHAAALASAVAHFPEPSCLIQVGAAKISVHAVTPLVSDRAISRRELALLLRQPARPARRWDN